MKWWGFLVVYSSGSSILNSCAMAVDQSKFRTCSQTSFCRRHREGHSMDLYKYKIEEDSVHFHIPALEEEEAEKKKKEPESNGGGIWKSFQDRLLGGSDDAGTNERDPYVRGPAPQLTGLLVNTAAETSTGHKEKLEFSVHAMSDGLVRLRVTEVYQEAGTAHEKARVTYDDLVLSTETMIQAEHAQWIRPGEDYLTKLVDPADKGNYMALQYGDKKGEHGMLLLFRIDSFAAFLYRESDLDAGPIITFGEQGLTHFEIRRTKESQEKPSESAEDDKSEDGAADEKDETKPEKEIVGYWEDGLAIYADGTREERKVVEEDHRKLTETELDREGMWEENFQSHKDSKPYGPMSVGADIGFPKSKALFGLPEHASSAMLKNTRGEGAEYKDPFRLYNLDVFEYDLDVPMALYGAVPLLISQSVNTGTSGVFWFNPSETFVDIQEDEAHAGKSSHWISESGVVDLFFLPGPTPKEFYRQYSKLTGVLALPPMFSLGYHQCRWNYKDEQDVYQVHNKFEELDYPYDVLWLDIEHTDGKRYFTWDDKLFPNPKEMQEKLWSQGRRMVTIIDPHVKRDDHYHIHKEATSKGLYIKDKDGRKDYDGWCWPGSSSYLDFTDAKARSWWAEQFAYDKYKGSTPSLFTWNDMNEPSVFNGPEVSMQKDLRNLRGDEHREWHNLYGMLFHRSTAEGQIRRNEGENLRPFVLSRSFFAGTQRYGAIWTGDNAAEWSHLEIASPMLLGLNLGAISFVGADVGGFFGNTDAELMTRWMQAGAYTPFFRGHAHHDAKRREPWMFGEETMVRLRKAAMARYALLPFWYTVFAEAASTGMPIMRYVFLIWCFFFASLFRVTNNYCFH
jgi:alpha 1,3-glucosidase